MSRKCLPTAVQASASHPSHLKNSLGKQNPKLIPGEHQLAGAAAAHALSVGPGARTVLLHKLVCWGLGPQGLRGPQKTSRLPHALKEPERSWDDLPANRHGWPAQGPRPRAQRLGTLSLQRFSTEAEGLITLGMSWDVLGCLGSQALDSANKNSSDRLG